MSKMPFKRGDIVQGYKDIGIVLEYNTETGLLWIEFPFPNKWQSVPGRGYPFSLSFDYKFTKVGEIDPPTSE